MGNLTERIPKGMLQLYGKTLFEWQIQALHEAGITDIYIVKGYRGEAIPYTHVGYRENPRWDSTNMFCSLMAASDLFVTDDCVVSYADIVYSAEAVRALLRGAGDVRITFDTNWLLLWQQRFENPLADAETFSCGENGTLAEIGARAETVDQIQGQYMGLLYFTPQGWRHAKRASALLPAEKLAALDMTSLLGLLLQHDVEVSTVPYSRPWGEVDSLSDLVLLEHHQPLRIELHAAHSGFVNAAAEEPSDE